MGDGKGTTAELSCDELNLCIYSDLDLTPHPPPGESPPPPPPSLSPPLTRSSPLKHLTHLPPHSVFPHQTPPPSLSLPPSNTSPLTHLPPQTPPPSLSLPLSNTSSFPAPPPLTQLSHASPCYTKKVTICTACAFMFSRHWVSHNGGGGGGGDSSVNFCDARCQEWVCHMWSTKKILWIHP